jgi:hypothetical protein
MQGHHQNCHVVPVKTWVFALLPSQAAVCTRGAAYEPAPSSWQDPLAVHEWVVTLLDDCLERVDIALTDGKKRSQGAEAAEAETAPMMRCKWGCAGDGACNLLCRSARQAWVQVPGVSAGAAA